MKTRTRATTKRKKSLRRSWGHLAGTLVNHQGAASEATTPRSSARRPARPESRGKPSAIVWPEQKGENKDIWSRLQ
eukprot:7790003-Pyramimonas_sp.AAC.1